MQRGLVTVAACAAMLAACGQSETAPPPVLVPIDTSPSATAPPAPAPTPNFVEEEKGTYFYVSAVSEEDRIKGKATGDVSGFRYLGKNDEGQHTLVSVSDDGQVTAKSYCSDPCSIIKRSNGSRIAYNPGSIIGGAFQDAMNGLLKPAGGKAVASESIESIAASDLTSPSQNTTLTLGSIKETDWQKIGMGCSCSFSVGTPRKEKLIAGGDGRTFFRLNGKDHLCTAPDIQAMFDGPVSMSCGSAAVQVTPYGKVEPGEDGHSSSARLHIADASGTLSLTGTWGCGC
jgi:hypothetical protein